MKRIVISKQTGRMANRLQVYANMIAMACELGAVVYNPSFDDYAHLFEGPSHQRGYVPDGVDAELSTLWRHLPYRFVRGFYELAKVGQYVPGSGIWVIKARTRSHVNLEDVGTQLIDVRWRWLFTQGLHFYADTWGKRHAPAIRRFLRPAAPYRQAASAVIDHARTQVDVVVGLHVRLGDYLTYLGGQFGFSPSQYAALARRVTDLFPPRRVGWVICSNVPLGRDCFEGLEVWFGPGTAVADMHALSCCDYIVGPPSTLNAWSAFYGNRPLYVVMDVERAVSLADFVACESPGALRLSASQRAALAANMSS